MDPVRTTPQPGNGAKALRRGLGPAQPGARLAARGLFMLLPALSVVFSGCRKDPGDLLPGPVAGNWPRASLSKVMEEMDERRFAVGSVGARMRLVLRDSVKGVEQGLSGTYLGDREGNWRLRMSVGDTLIADMAFYGNQVDLWLPRKGRFLRGEREVLSKMGDDELCLLARVGNVADLFFPRAWTPHATERRIAMQQNRECVNVFEKAGPFRRCVLTVMISPEKPVADGMAIYNRTGSKIGSVQYDDYRFPAARAGAPESGLSSLPYPGRITLVGGTANRSLQMEVEELMLNTPIPLSKFEIALPEGQQRMDLNEALKRGVPIWD